LAWPPFPYNLLPKAGDIPFWASAVLSKGEAEAKERGWGQNPKGGQNLGLLFLAQQP